MPDQVAVTVPPTPTVAGLAAIVTPATVMTLLTASRCQLFCANRRNSYVPAGKAAGSVTSRLPLVIPVVYHHAADAVSGAPVGMRPTQSVDVGVPIPFQL